MGKYFAYYLLGSKKGWKSAGMPEGAEERKIKVEYKALNFVDVARWWAEFWTGMRMSLVACTAV